MLSMGQKYDPAPTGKQPEHRIDDGPAVLLGLMVIAVFFGSFVTWAAIAPLNSAAIASGSIRIKDDRKTVQHLEGGIITEILVRDGDLVAAGQVLVRLDDTQPRASLKLLNGHYLAAKALEARLIAERDEQNEIDFPAELKNSSAKAEVDKILLGQINIFRARQNSIAAQATILSQREAALNEEIAGLQSKIVAQIRQIDLIHEEIVDLGWLVQKGLAKKARLLALQRTEAEIKGQLGENAAMVARTKERIIESQLQISELKTTMFNEVVMDLRKVQSELFDFSERRRAAADIVRRTQILAPIAGEVVGLQVHTAGGVIGPGHPLLDIVPSERHLMVEVRVDPNDIDIVQPGLTTQVRLTPLNSRTTKPVEGKVAWVSADRLTDENTGVPYYLARINLTESLETVLGNTVLYPGMPAEVMIATGTRTALEYFLKPITVNFGRAFREQ